ncbi:probable ribonuclease ZC3H12D [Tachyglossus aculeatus]|uniref:probable ribonuclease ZC3H12D n=1 Tax=Tachyglossus aculeatus TaxID=9261 RepID=UPI0018F53FEE|nr:probable ribonuclease ZC3H12D [Tachyglossus aculeatus]
MGSPPGKLDFLCKLGYAKEDAVKVLAKLGPRALVNDVLQELIQMGSSPRAEGSPGPQLVARGACGSAGALPKQHRGADPEQEAGDTTASLRPIVIDGSNVAMSHGNKEAFSCRGIQLAVDWFKERGHTYIKVFVPSWRKDPPRSDTPITEQHVLEELEKQTILVYTPSRRVNGKRVVCYDDRYIVKVAYEKDGVIVSNDNYRDLQSENPEWKWFIEQRLLMYSFVNDKFMPPDDPLGRRGPTLTNFLSRKPKLPEPSWQHCPYGRKCTYGVKCKFYHPERLNQAQLSVADELRAKTKACSGAEEERPVGDGAAKPEAVSLLPGTHPPGAWASQGSSGSSLGGGGGLGPGWTEERCRAPAAGTWADGARGRWEPERGLSPPSHAGDLGLVELQLSRLELSDAAAGPGRCRPSPGTPLGLDDGAPGCNRQAPFPRRPGPDCSCFLRSRPQPAAGACRRVPPGWAPCPGPAAQADSLVATCLSSKAGVPAERRRWHRRPPRPQVPYGSRGLLLDLFSGQRRADDQTGHVQPPGMAFLKEANWGHDPSPAVEYEYLASTAPAQERARTALYNLFPHQEVDRAMASRPNLIDVTSIIELIQEHGSSSRLMGTSQE